MNSLQRQSCELLFLLKVTIILLSPFLVIQGSWAFPTATTTSRLSRGSNVRGHMSRSWTLTPLKAVFDPSELANHAAAAMTHSHHHTASSWEAILSTMYTTTMDGMVGQHADTATSSLEAGRSTVAPNLQNMVDSATETVGNGKQQQLPEQVVQRAINKGGGWLSSMRNVKLGPPVDTSDYKIVETMPGFKETRGILPKATMDMQIPRGTPETFFGQVKNSASMLNVMNKLPTAAFVYVLVDFFLLRPGIDLYKEDIEEEPTDALAETLAVTTVRMGTFAVISFITLLLFNRL